MKSKLLLVFASLALAGKSFAYETMIRHRYVNCMTCHHSSTGGGLLNAYGKVIANEISTFKTAKTSKQRRWEHGLQARLSHFRAPDRNRTFPMQLDYLTAFKGKRVTFEGVLSKTPTDTLSEKPDLADQFLVKKALFSYQYNNKLSFQAGRDHLDVGLNLVDHTLFIRNNNKRGVDDFFSVLRANYYSSGYKISPFVYLPSFQERYESDEKGLGIKMEKYLTRWRSSLSFSQLMGDTDDILRQESAVAFKTGFNILLFMGQASFTNRKLHANGSRFDQESYLFGAHLYPLKSLELRVDMEKLWVSLPFRRNIVRSNHGVSWKPHRNISLQYNAQRNTQMSDEFQSIYQIYFNGWFL